MSGFVEIYSEQSTQSSQRKQTRTQYMNKLMKQKRANEAQSPAAKKKRRVYAKECRNVNGPVRVPSPQHSALRLSKRKDCTQRNIGNVNRSVRVPCPQH